MVSSFVFSLLHLNSLIGRFKLGFILGTDVNICEGIKLGRRLGLKLRELGLKLGTVFRIKIREENSPTLGADSFEGEEVGKSLDEVIGKPKKRNEMMNLVFIVSFIIFFEKSKLNRHRYILVTSHCHFGVIRMPMQCIVILMDMEAAISILQ